MQNFIASGHGVVVSIQDSNAGGPQFEFWYFCFYFFLFIYAPFCCGRSKAIFFGLTMNKNNALYGQKSIAKTFM